MSASAIDKPPLALLISEPARALVEWLSQAWRPAADRQPALPAGDGHPVVIYPGLATDGLAVRPLRNHCRALGYAAFDWGQGFNTGPQGDVDRWLRALADDTARQLDGHAQTATLIGWSMGGLYAREVAKPLAPRVRQVITIGTPFNSAADPSHAGWLLRLLSPGVAEPDPALLQRLRAPPPLPTAALYSRGDGVVAWQACRHDRRAPGLLDIEVSGSHLGMGSNPQVLAVVAELLALSASIHRDEPAAAAAPTHARDRPARRRRLRAEGAASGRSGRRGAALQGPLVPI